MPEEIPPIDPSAAGSNQAQNTGGSSGANPPNNQAGAGQDAGNQPTPQPTQPKIPAPTPPTPEPIQTEPQSIQTKPEPVQTEPPTAQTPPIPVAPQYQVPPQMMPQQMSWGYPAMPQMPWGYPAMPQMGMPPATMPAQQVTGPAQIQPQASQQARTPAQPPVVKDITHLDELATPEQTAQAANWPPQHMTPEQRPKLQVDPNYAVPLDSDGNADIIQLVNNILIGAKKSKASDIHVEPKDKLLLVRFRIDGEFKEYYTFPETLTNAILTRLIVQSGLKIDMTRVPQDGKIAFKIEEQEIDIRVSTFPTMYGDKIVMRLLERDAKAKSLQELGFQGKSLMTIQQNLERTYGMVLITGPTGSGKSTSLFAMLSAYDPFKYNISTLEDPIEYVIKGVNQAQVHAEIGFDFADGLRSLVRQDPDIIMIGEVRDKISSNLAIQAALTGHLVFATLHANSAAATIQRLANMGVDSFLAASALNVIISQRLVRKICDNCKVPVQPPSKYLESIQNLVGGAEAAKKISFMKGQGCDQCGNTGYKGRLAIYEVLPITPAIEKVIIEHPIASFIQEAAVKEGMITIKENGLMAAIQGKTTLEEVLLAVDETFM